MRLIDADRLRKNVLDWENCYNGFSDTYDKARIIDEIDEQPSIDAEPVKHGRWINGICSECGCDRVITKVYRNDEVAWTATYKDNYCPNCGAKMNEVNNEIN